MRANARAYLPVCLALAVLTLAAAAFATSDGLAVALARLLVLCGAGGVGLWVFLTLAARRGAIARTAPDDSSAEERAEEREGGAS